MARVTKREIFYTFVIVICVMAMTLDWLANSIIPRAHGRFFPVTTPLEITALHSGEASGFETRIEGWADKIRDCSYISIDWRMGVRNERFAPVGAAFLGPPQIRIPGRLEWDDLYVDLSPTQVTSLSFADVTHDCGWPWLVVTPFYDGTHARDYQSFLRETRALMAVGNDIIEDAGYGHLVNELQN